MEAHQKLWWEGERAFAAQSSGRGAAAAAAGTRGHHSTKGSAISLLDDLDERSFVLGMNTLVKYNPLAGPLCPSGARARWHSGDERTKRLQRSGASPASAREVGGEARSAKRVASSVPCVGTEISLSSNKRGGSGKEKGKLRECAEMCGVRQPHTP